MPPNQDSSPSPTDPNMPADQPMPAMLDPLETPAGSETVPAAPTDSAAQTPPPVEPTADPAAYGQGSFQPSESPEAPEVPEVMPDPTAQQPTAGPETMPLPAATPMPPESAPTAPSVMPAPTNDPTQPGYIPPTVSPAAVPAAPQTSRGNKAKLIRIAIVAIVALFLLAGGGYLLKDTLFTGSTIKTSDLIEDSANGVSFKRPSDWTKSPDSTSSQAAFTEGGKAADDTDQVLLVGAQSIGTNYDNLTDTEKTKFYDEVKSRFSDKSAFEDETCKEATTPEVSKVSLPNYTDGISISVTCEKFAKRNIRAHMKMVVGLKERRMSLVAILAVDKTWDKSGDALDEILTSFKPAEE